MDRSVKDGSAAVHDNLDILCIGIADVDILVRPVDGTSAAGDTVRVDEIRMANGGDAMNVAVNMSRLGNRVAFAGQVGDDPFGQFLTGRMAQLSIDTRGLAVSRVASTGSAICLVQSGGERSFLYSGGTNELFSPTDVDMALISMAKVIFIGGTYCMPRFDGEGAAKLLQSAQKKGKITAMDVTWCLDGDWDKVFPCLPHLDYFMPSISEARMITGKEDPVEMADVLLERGVKNVIIKRGKDGAMLKNEQTSIVCSPVSVAVLDTTGAGDAFNSGFLTGVIKKWSLDKSIKFGCATSAFCIQQMGACVDDLNFEKVCAVAFNAL